MRLSPRIFASFLLLLAFLRCGQASASSIIQTDVCVYGGTSGGVIAAVQAARHGKSVALAVFGQHVGGMTAGGLGWTDIGSNGNTYIQGVAREYYTRIGAKYGTNAAKFVFEPKVAEAVFQEMLAEAGVFQRPGQRLAAVTREGLRIKEIAMDDGTIYRARIFIDASYEGDLLAMSGVSWTLGREAAATYGETLAGARGSDAFASSISPYVVPGQPASGLLPCISGDTVGATGTADARVEAYNYRLCLTSAAANRIAITAPPGYSEATYELLGRYIDASVAAGSTLSLTNFITLSAMPNSKTDSNNSGMFSTDYVGMSENYATSSYAQRAVIEQQHRDYTQGFLYYLGHSTRVPSAVRSAMLGWGWCKDEFTDRSGFGEFYVREARRMIGDYVMLQQNVQSTRVAEDPVGLATYTIDCHYCQRVVQGGVVKNTGNLGQSVSKPYGVSYRSLVPKASECDNLLVPWALSASHVAFSSLRMEPVFMILGQSVGTAGALAIDHDIAVQEVRYDELALALTADKQLLTQGVMDNSGTIVDNTDGAGVTVTGDWTTSASTAGYWGADYLHDGNAEKGTKSVRFTPDLAAAGTYTVYLRWSATTNRATAVPVDVVSAGGTSTFIVNQQANGGVWYKLTTTDFDAGKIGSLVVRTDGTAIDSLNGFVIADAARWVFTPADGSQLLVQILATDPVTRLGLMDSARVVLMRSAADATDALTVRYSLSGTAQTSDFTALSGSATFAAGATVVPITIQALQSSIGPGIETLTLTLLPGTGYSPGARSSATIRLVNQPIEVWRRAKFSTAQWPDLLQSGDFADPDGDGFSNLQEYTFGLDPTLPNSASPTSSQYQGGDLTLAYTRLKSANDVSLWAEGSYDLSTWGTEGVVQEVSRLDQGASERITVRLIPSPIGQMGYLRLRTSR